MERGTNMSTNQFTYNPFVAGIKEIRSSWGWFLTAGIGLLVLGAICIIGSVAATFATILVVGWLLLFGGVVALVHAFRMRTWSGFFLFFVTALLRGFTGYLLIRYPLAGAVAFTLVLASFFVVGGLFRTIGAAMMKFPIGDGSCSQALSLWYWESCCWCKCRFPASGSLALPWAWRCL